MARSFHRVWLVVGSLLIAWAVAGCGLQSLRTEMLTPTARVVTVVVPGTPQVVTATPVPPSLPTTTRTLPPTSTPYPTLPPLPTWTPSTLTGQHPSDLDAFRFVFNRHRLPFYSGFLWNQLEEGRTAGLRYERRDIDLNGDGLPEILLTGYAGVFGEGAYNSDTYTAILSYSPDGTWRDMYFAAGTGHYCAEVRSVVQGKRVIVDFLSCNGGSGLRVNTWDQQWIQCGKSSCAAVFSLQPLYSDENSSPVADSTYSVTRVEQSDADFVQTITERFQTSDILMDWTTFPPGPDQPGLSETIPGGMPPHRVIGPNTRETYRWDGQVYSLVKREQIGPAMEVSRELSEETARADQFVSDALSKQFDLNLNREGDYNKHRMARESFWGLPGVADPARPLWESARGLPEAAAVDTRPGNRVAGIIGAKDHAACRLTVQSYASTGFTLIGRKDLYCTPQFTQVAWADVDGDGEDELLLSTIGMFEDQAYYAPIRRLRIYRAKDGLEEIAHVDGFINGSDGVGIRWQTDAKGLRVEAGLPFEGLEEGCEYKLSCMNLDRRFQVYRWDKAAGGFRAEK